jgi:hypothetical protein
LRHLEAALNRLDIGRTAQCASLIAPYPLAVLGYTPINGSPEAFAAHL